MAQRSIQPDTTPQAHSRLSGMPAFASCFEGRSA